MENFINRDKLETMIEIGVGSGFTANYCRSKGFRVKTLDIDSEKTPDILANVVEYEFKEKYDYLMAFEILEHIPFTEFQKIIEKIPSFVNKYAFISLPRNERRLIDVQVRFPIIKKIRFGWTVLARKLFTETHLWELDYKNYKQKKVEKLMEDSGLKIRKKIKNKYIYFYALEICNKNK